MIRPPRDYALRALFEKLIPLYLGSLARREALWDKAARVETIKDVDVHECLVSDTRHIGLKTT
jgi:hypothetical protein